MPNDKTQQIKPATIEQLAPFIEQQLQALAASLNTLMAMIPSLPTDNESFNVIGVKELENGTQEYSVQPAVGNAIAGGDSLRKSIQLMKKSIVKREHADLPDVLNYFNQLSISLDGVINSLLDRTDLAESIQHEKNYDIIMKNTYSDGSVDFSPGDVDDDEMRKSTKKIDLEQSKRIVRQLRKAMYV